MIDHPPFPGFRDEAFAFLRELEVNNRRDWFKPRKEVYQDEVRWPMECLVADAARRAGERDLPLTGHPKESIFRIYRDVRFSKNKQPYKTHVGAVLSRSGSRKDDGVVYVHVEPGKCFLAGGFYRPEMPLLRAIRTRIVENPATFYEMRDRLEESGLSIAHGDDTLVRMPRGFEAYRDRDVADVLKWKSLLVRRAVSDDELQESTFTEQVLAMMQDTLPLLEFGWRAAGARDARP